MDVVRHKDVAQKLESIFLASFFQYSLKSTTSFLRLEDVTVAVAADRDEVKVTFIVTAGEALRHGRSVREPDSWLKRQPTLRFAKDGPPEVRGRRLILGES